MTDKDFVRRPRILGPSQIGEAVLMDAEVIVGHPSKAALLRTGDLSTSSGAIIGDRSILRAGTVVYEDVILGCEVQTAHHVVIREGARIGDRCVFGNGTVVRERAVLGRNVRLMEHAVVAEGALVGNDVFVGPNVSMTAGRYMTGALEASGRMSNGEAAEREGRYWHGPSVVIEDEARIGANAVILAGVRLGRACIVAAGAVVSGDVPPGALVAGNPGRLLKRPPA
jgi:acetyltransferase-like isoleucine patch superfamily enzyme